jgi:hypothetical protein
MKTQTAISVNPVIGGPTNSLDLTELKSLLESGWVVAEIAESAVGPILIILEKDSDQPS